MPQGTGNTLAVSPRASGQRKCQLLCFHRIPCVTLASPSSSIVRHPESEVRRAMPECIGATATPTKATANQGMVSGATTSTTPGYDEPVRLLNGRTAIVVATADVAGAADMWDLTVSSVHDFAVGTGQFVVHNCGSYEEQVRQENGDFSGAEHQGLADTNPDAMRGEGTPNETYIDAKEHPAGATNKQVFDLSREVAAPSEGELYSTQRGRQLMRYAALYQDTFTPFEY